MALICDLENPGSSIEFRIIWNNKRPPIYTDDPNKVVQGARGGRGGSLSWTSSNICKELPSTGYVVQEHG